MRAAYCLEQAEHCLRLADSATDSRLAAEYRHMFRHYAALAEAARKLAEFRQDDAAE